MCEGGVFIMSAFIGGPWLGHHSTSTAIHIAFLYLHRRLCRGAIRPCVIVLAVRRPDGINTMVRVAPITHSPPDDPATAFELPLAVKRHLRLDAERSWVILDEVNEFGWPGFDLRPVPRAADGFSHGFLPPRLFDQLIAKMVGIWRQGLGQAVRRD